MPSIDSGCCFSYYPCCYYCSYYGNLGRDQTCPGLDQYLPSILWSTELLLMRCYAKIVLGPNKFGFQVNKTEKLCRISPSLWYTHANSKSPRSGEWPNMRHCSNIFNYGTLFAGMLTTNLQSKWLVGPSFGMLISCLDLLLSALAGPWGLTSWHWLLHRVQLLSLACNAEAHSAIHSLRVPMGNLLGSSCGKTC